MRVWQYAWQSLRFWHFPVYGENACVLEGRHGDLVGTKALGEENGPCLLYRYASLAPFLFINFQLVSTSQQGVCYLPLTYVIRQQLPHLPVHTDSALHILSNRQHTKMRNMITKRHNVASALILQAPQKGPCGANQIAYTDIGSADNLAEQGLDLRNTINKMLPYWLLPAKPNSTCFESLFSS